MVLAMLLHLALATFLTQTPAPDAQSQLPIRREHHFVVGIPLGLWNGFAQHTNPLGDAYSSTTLGLGLSLGYLFETDRFAAGLDVDGLLGSSLNPNATLGELPSRTPTYCCIC